MKTAFFFSLAVQLTALVALPKAHAFDLPTGAAMLYTPSIEIAAAETIIGSSCEICKDIKKWTKVTLVATLNGCVDSFLAPRTADVYLGDYIKAIEYGNGRVSLPITPIGIWNNKSALVDCFMAPQERFTVFIDGSYSVDKIDLNLQVIKQSYAVAPF